MRLHFYTDNVDRMLVFTFKISEHELCEARSRMDVFEKDLLKECSGSKLISDKLMGLERIALALERENDQMTHNTSNVDDATYPNE